jgi:hypothetical protein
MNAANLRWRETPLSRSELIRELRILFRECQFAVEDFSNPRREPAYVILVYLHRDSASLQDPESELLERDGFVKVLQLHVSRFFPLYYHYSWKMMGLDFQHWSPSRYPADTEDWASRLDAMLREKGFARVDERVAAQPVPGLELPTIEADQVRIFNLLFGDTWQRVFANGSSARAEPESRLPVRR